MPNNFDQALDEFWVILNLQEKPQSASVKVSIEDTVDISIKEDSDCLLLTASPKQKFYYHPDLISLLLSINNFYTFQLDYPIHPFFYDETNWGIVAILSGISVSGNMIANVVTILSKKIEEIIRYTY